MRWREAWSYVGHWCQVCPYLVWDLILSNFEVFTLPAHHRAFPLTFLHSFLSSPHYWRYRLGSWPICVTQVGVLFCNSRGVGLNVVQTWSRSGEWWISTGKVSQLSYTYRVRPAELSSLTTLQELVLSYLWLASPVVAFLRNRRYPGIAS